MTRWCRPPAVTCPAAWCSISARAGAGSRAGPRARALKPDEPVENPRPVGRRNAWAAVLYRQHDRSAGSLALDDDVGSRGPLEPPGRHIVAADLDHLGGVVVLRPGPMSQAIDVLRGALAEYRGDVDMRDVAGGID